MTVPARPKIYHIAHVDRLASIATDGLLWSDAEVLRRKSEGTMIGMSSIKQRRLTSCLYSHPGLLVGACVPFYFCPRSVMLYLIHRANHPELTYRGGQDPIIHLEADLSSTIEWTEAQGHRWAFTLSNAGSNYFEDRADLTRLDEIDWHAVQARDWTSCKEHKQAEFLVEECVPWHLVERIGVRTQATANRVLSALQSANHRPRLEIIGNWYC